MTLGLCGLATGVYGADPIVAPHPAEPTTADKRGYTLFHPTPRRLMRELSADRPDVTEAPNTVDAGHFQIEMDLLRYSYDRHNSARDPVRVESVSIAPMILKAGILNSVDLELGISPYNSIRVRDDASGSLRKSHGFGDLVPRIKINLWGNEGGKTAVALLPFIKLPTNQNPDANRSVEGGLTVPTSIELPYDTGLGFDVGIEVLRDSTGDAYHVEFINTLTVGHEIVGPIGAYVEFVSIASQERGAPWVAAFDMGVTYQVSRDLRLDAGINLGLTRSAEDLNPFVGLTWRF